MQFSPGSTDSPTGASCATVDLVLAVAASLLSGFIVVAPPLQVCLYPPPDDWCASPHVELSAELRAYRVLGPVEVIWVVDGREVRSGAADVRPGKRYPLSFSADLRRPPREVSVTVRHARATSADSWRPVPGLAPCPFDLAAGSLTMDGGRGLVGTVANRGPFYSAASRVRWMVNGKLVSDSVVDPLPPGAEATLLLPWNEIPRSRRAFLRYARDTGIPLPPAGDRYLGAMAELAVDPAPGDLDSGNDAAEIMVLRRWLLSAWAAPGR